MRRRLAPLLFQDDDPEGARSQWASPVEPARVSESAKSRADSKLTADGHPVQSFRTLIDDLTTLTLNEVSPPVCPEHAMQVMAQPTRLQKRAFELPEIDPAKIAASTSPG